VAGLTDAESYEYRQAGYLRALQILQSRLPEIEALAHQLFNQRRVELTDSLAPEFSKVLRSQRPK
jgi:hypothetical protein